MRTDVARLDLTGRRRSLIGYSAGMAIYTLIVVALYPAFQHSTSIDQLIKSDAAAAALFGVSGPISTTGGWLNANLYANFLPLVLLLMAVGYGAAAVAGQDQDGTLCLLATLPLRRSTIVTQKAATMVAQTVVVAIVVAAFVMVGRSFHLDVHLSAVAGVSLTSALMAIDFGLLALVVGCWTGRRGTAIGVAAAVAAASYLISSLAPVVSWLHPARFASLFYWSVSNNQATAGASAADLGVLVGTATFLLAVAIVRFDRLDLS